MESLYVMFTDVDTFCLCLLTIWLNDSSLNMVFEIAALKTQEWLPMQYSCYTHDPCGQTFYRTVRKQATENILEHSVALIKLGYAI